MNTKEQCLNCGQNLIGHFCHKCGQAKIDTTLGFRQLVSEFFGEIFTYDSRVYRTLFPLLLRPGWLTHEFKQGRRANYVPPLRLYLFISFILFLWLAMVDTAGVNISSNDQPSLEVAEEIEQVRNEVSEIPAWLEGIGKRLITNLAAIEQNPEPFTDMLSSRLPQVMFLLLPVFALILWLHFAMSGFNYLQHIIFALHFHAFSYLLILVFSIVGRVIPFDFDLIILLLAYVYLALAIRKNYGSGKLACALKTFSILFFYLFALSIGLGLFFAVNVIGYS